MTWRLILGSAAAGLLIVAALIGGCIALGELHAEATARSLYLSVVDVTPSIDPTDYATDRCEPGKDARDWVCVVPGAFGSGNEVTYGVRVRPDGSCWDAERKGRGPDMPRRVSGCVLRRHD